MAWRGAGDSQLRPGPEGPRSPGTYQHGSRRREVVAGRRPGWGFLRVSPLRGTPLKEVQRVWSESFRACRGTAASAGPGRAGLHGSGPGPARASHAPQPSPRRPRSLRLSGRSPRGPRLPALRPPPGPSHAVRGAGAVGAAGRPQASSPRRAALSPWAQSFRLRSSFQRGPARGLRWWRGWNVSRTPRARRPCRVATAPGLSYQDTSTTLPPRGVGTGQREEALLSLRRQGLTRPPASGGMPGPRSGVGRSARPAAAGWLQLRPGVRAPTQPTR